MDEWGCKHYKRGCSFITPCCKKEYVCRVCHDDAEQHTLDRKAVKIIKCLSCGSRQGVSNKCHSCSKIFGKYFCPICNLFDNIDKQQFHCDGCGICRVGGREKYFHCPKCALCLDISMKDSHKCLENVSHNDCAVCLEDLHTSREGVHVFSCGHLLHRKCFQGMLKTQNFACPLCNKTMVEIDWKALDRERDEIQMPEEYRNMYVQILCRDCHKECRTLFHIVGLKCENCGSYNTVRAAEPEQNDDAATPSSGETANQGEDAGDGAQGQAVNAIMVTEAAEVVPSSAGDGEAVPNQPSK